MHSQYRNVISGEIKYKKRLTMRVECIQNTILYTRLYTLHTTCIYIKNIK